MKAACLILSLRSLSIVLPRNLVWGWISPGMAPCTIICWIWSVAATSDAGGAPNAAEGAL